MAIVTLDQLGKNRAPVNNALASIGRAAPQPNVSGPNTAHYQSRVVNNRQFRQPIAGMGNAYAGDPTKPQQYAPPAPTVQISPPTFVSGGAQPGPQKDRPISRTQVQNALPAQNGGLVNAKRNDLNLPGFNFNGALNGGIPGFTSGVNTQNPITSGINLHQITSGTGGASPADYMGQLLQKLKDQMMSGINGAGQRFGKDFVDLIGGPVVGATGEINSKNKDLLNKYYNNFDQFDPQNNYGQSLLDPNVQAAQEQAANDQMRYEVDRQRNADLRRLGSSQAAGGRVGSGSVQSAFTAAEQAAQAGQRQNTMDAFNRKMAAGQLGTSVLNDRAKSIYDIMNQNYFSPQEMAGILAQVMPEMFGSLVDADVGMAQAAASAMPNF